MATFYPTEIRNLGNGYGTQSYHDNADPEEIDMAVSSADPTMSRNPHPEVHISCRPFSSQASKQSGLMRVLHRWNLNRWHIRAPPGHYKVKSSIFLFCTNALLCMIFPLSCSCFGGRCYKKAWIYAMICWVPINGSDGPMS